MPDSLTSTLTSYYDAVPYESHPFPQTAVEHLEAIAYLFGLQAPPPASARVLELGCASGGNLIPFAARHPQASAMGLDLSKVQVEQGAGAILRAALANVELRVFDLAQVDASFGQFDYIVCHGVYSWVPGPVQDAILRICCENLAPDGVAYVSYNAYPGWKAREIVRDAMILRGGPRDTPEEKLSYARGMLEFLEQSARADSVLKKTLDETMPIVRRSSSDYLLHEFLEPCNAPCYFKEFVARAEARGLAYLGDAEPSSMFVQNYGDKVREPLLRECGGSQVLMEQYLDFLVNRTFRQTLLVKQDRGGDIRFRLDPVRIRGLEYAGIFSPADGGALTLDAREQACKALRSITVMLRSAGAQGLGGGARCPLSGHCVARSADRRGGRRHGRAARSGRAARDGDARRAADPRRRAHPPRAGAGRRGSVGAAGGAAVGANRSRHRAVGRQLGKCLQPVA